MNPPGPPRSAWGYGHGPWETFGDYPLTLHEVEPLIHQADEITEVSSCAVYDALFVALTESEGTVVVTADGRLLNTLEGIPFAHLLHPLERVGE